MLIFPAEQEAPHPGNRFVVVILGQVYLGSEQVE